MRPFRTVTTRLPRNIAASRLNLHAEGSIALALAFAVAKNFARRRSDRGVEFATALPRGTVLRQDDCLLLPTLHLVVRVIELAEPVLIVRPATPTLWALYAYQIGNSHQPIMLTDDALVCPDILGMEQVLTYHGIPFERDERPFTPVSQVPSHGHVPS